MQAFVARCARDERRRVHTLKDGVIWRRSRHLLSLIIVRR